MDEGEKILPCPHCGSEAELQDDKDDTYYIVCLHCKSSMESPNPLYLIRIWNEEAKRLTEDKP